MAYGFAGSGDTPDTLLDGSGNITQKYLTLPGDVLVTIKPNSTSAAATTYSFPNIHGDVFATVDADGLLKSTHMTGPFGEQLPNNTNPTNTVNGTSWNYVGQHQKLTDTETSPIAGGIIQMGARVYIPTLGRFLSVDSVEGGTDNNYAYANDPVNPYDLDGKAIPFLLIGAAILYGGGIISSGYTLIKKPSKANAAWFGLSLVPGASLVRAPLAVKNMLHAITGIKAVHTIDKGTKYMQSKGYIPPQQKSRSKQVYKPVQLKTLKFNNYYRRR